MQLSTEPAMRGRVMAIRLAIALGGTPIGAPVVGWVADHWGPRWSIGVAAGAGIAAALFGTYARQLLKVRTVDRSDKNDQVPPNAGLLHWREPREGSATTEI